MKNQEKIKREKLSFKKTNDKEQTQNQWEKRFKVAMIHVYQYLL